MSNGDFVFLIIYNIIKFFKKIISDNNKCIIYKNMLEHGAARNSAISPTLIIRKLSFVDWSFNWDDCSFSANSWFCGNNSWFFRVKSIATMQESRASIHWEAMWVCALSLPTSPSELPYITYLFSLSPLTNFPSQFVLYILIPLTKGVLAHLLKTLVLLAPFLLLMESMNLSLLF